MNQRSLGLMATLITLGLALTFAAGLFFPVILTLIKKATQ